MSAGLEYYMASKYEQYRFTHYSETVETNVETYTEDMEEKLIDVIHLYEDDNIENILNTVEMLYPVLVAFDIFIFILYFIVGFYFINSMMVSFKAELYLLQTFINHDPSLLSRLLKSDYRLLVRSDSDSE